VVLSNKLILEVCTLYWVLQFVKRWRAKSPHFYVEKVYNFELQWTEKGCWDYVLNQDSESLRWSDSHVSVFIRRKRLNTCYSWTVLHCWEDMFCVRLFSPRPRRSSKSASAACDDNIKNHRSNASSSSSASNSNNNRGRGRPTTRSESWEEAWGNWNLQYFSTSRVSCRNGFNLTWILHEAWNTAFRVLDGYIYAKMNTTCVKH
jgi:hypothetical protein